MDTDVIKKLKDIFVQKIPALDVNSLNPEEDIRALGIDSLDFVELIFEIETIFDIEIPTEMLPKISTVKSLVEIIETTLGSKGSS